MLSINWLSLEPFSIANLSLESWFSFAISNEGAQLGEISIILCTDEELLDLNVRHLNHDYFTDIITFDYCEDDIVSGDLFVSVDRVRDNASQLGCSFEDELNRVFIHGVLHLCGYGDKSDDEAITMREKEDFYLNKYEGFT